MKINETIYVHYDEKLKLTTLLCAKNVFLKSFSWCKILIDPSTDTCVT